MEAFGAAPAAVKDDNAAGVAHEVETTIFQLFVQRVEISPAPTPGSSLDAGGLMTRRRLKRAA